MTAGASHAGALPVRAGLMMDDYPLSLTGVVERAEQFARTREIVFRRPDGALGRTTFGACAMRARCLASALTALGVAPGEPVATLMWNQPEHVEAYFAVPPTGAVLHTLNPRLGPEELRFIVDDAEDRAVIVDESLLEVLECFRDARRLDHVIVVRRSDRALPDGFLDYGELIAAHPPMRWPAGDERAAASMCYTSGTTGRPKGVVYSHRALVLHAIAAALPDVFDISRGDTVLPVVPMFHANAWGLIYTAALTGAGLVLPGPKLDAISVLDLLAGERVTFTAGVPTVWLDLLGALDAEPGRWDLTALRELGVGGAAAPPSMIRGFDRHGLTVVHLWGMTELSPVGTVSRPGPELDGADEEARFASRTRQGTASPMVEIRAIDDRGEAVPWDDETIGELEVRGPWVAAAYHGGRGSDKFSADGWFATGDVVTIDGAGSIRIRDRAKDLVKSGGEWISSVDLENELMAHPAVAAAAVIAVPDERWGERPAAAVVLRPGEAADADALREHLAAVYAKWQIPDRFVFVAEIPRTSTGKFDKRALRAQMAS